MKQSSDPPSGAQAPALPVDAIMALIAKVPHEADHGRPGHPAAWCERCALEAQLTALLEAAEEGRKDTESADQIANLSAKLDRFPSSAEALYRAIDLLELHVPASDAQTDAVVAVSNVIAWVRSYGEYPRRLDGKDEEVFPYHLARALPASPNGD